MTAGKNTKNSNMFKSNNRFTKIKSKNNYFKNLNAFLLNGKKSYISLESDMKDVIADQQTRALAIIGEIIRTGKDTIVTMDGCEGRFVWTLLTLAKQHGLTIKVKLIEQNYVMHAHHCLNYEDPTFKHIVIPLKMDIMKYELKSNELLYLNFCGIGKSSKSVLQLLEKSNSPFFLSFSERSGYASGLSYFQQIKLLLSDKEVLCKRKNFITYFIDEPIMMKSESDLEDLKESLDDSDYEP